MQDGDGAVAAVQRIGRRVRYDAPGFAGTIGAFLREHLGDEGRSTSLAGREADIKALNAWLTDETAADRLLIAAPAGRGKSALLAHWIAQLSSDWSVVFVAAGGSRRTTHPAVFCHGLAARIADALGDADLRLAPPGDAVAHYRKEIRRLLLTFNPAVHDRIVVVVDGLDEIDRGHIVRDLFPDAPPPGLRFLVSASLTHETPTADAWRQRLNWPEDRRSHDLPPLDATAIAATPDTVDDVARLTSGEPFLINLYAGGDDERDVAQAGDLAAMAPGLNGFFDRWFADRRRPRGRDWPPNRAFLTTAALIGQAKAPLSDGALSALLGASGEIGPMSVDDLLTPLRPFLAEDDIAFTHPRLADFFGGCRRLSPDRLRHLDDEIVASARQAYLRWGDEALESTSNGDVTADHAHLLDHYLDHLIEAQASVADLMRLTSNGWRRARLAQDHGERDFAFDVECIRRHIAGRPDSAAATGLPNHVSAQMRCALISSSIGSLGTEIRPAVIRRAVETSQITIGGALDLISYMESNRSRIYALIDVAALADAALADEVLEAARDYGGSYGWSHALAELAAKLPAERRGPMVQQALNLALAITDPEDRANAIAALAPHIPAEQRDAALREAIKATTNIETGKFAFLALAALAPVLPPDLLEPARSAARGIGDDFCRTRALAKLAPYAPPPTRHTALREALQTARDVKAPDLRALALARPAPDLMLDALQAVREIGGTHKDTEALALMAPHAAEDRREALLREAFEAARDEHYDFMKGPALAALAPHLPPDLLPPAVDMARELRDDRSRCEALAALAARLPDDDRVAMLREALAAAREVDVDYERSLTLADLAPYLPSQLVGEALASARGIYDDYASAKALARLVKHVGAGQREEVLRLALNAARGDGSAFMPRSLLAALAPHLSDSAYNALLAQTLASTERISGDDWRSEALAELAPQVSPELLPRAVAIARDMADEPSRLDALSALAAHMPASERYPILQQAIAVASNVGRDAWAARWLADLAPNLPTDLLQQALATARGLADMPPRVKALTALATHLPEAERYAVLREALDAARGADPESASARALAMLAPVLPEALLPEALDAALAISSDDARSAALTTLAPRIPAEERDAVLDRALTAARAIEWEYQKTETLTALAPLLPVKCLQQALEAARSIEAPAYRSEALTGLARHVTPERRDAILAAALAAARDVEASGARAGALAALAPLLEVAERTPVLQEILSLAPRMKRPSLIELLTRLLTDDRLGFDDAARLAFAEDVAEVSRWWP